MRKYMQEALLEAKKAFDMGEVPIGAVIVHNDVIIGRGHNRTETLKDPTAHAELLAIRQAAQTLGGWRLTDCCMYVTCEPCSMCAGAIVWARIDTLNIGTMDAKSGACGSVLNIPQNSRLNHFVDINTGIMEEECSLLIKKFFRKLREEKKAKEKL